MVRHKRGCVQPSKRVHVCEEVAEERVTFVALTHVGRYGNRSLALSAKESFLPPFSAGLTP